MNNTPFDEPTSTPRRATAIVTPPCIDNSSSQPFPRGNFWPSNDKYSSDEDFEELDLRNVSAFDELDRDDGFGGGRHHTQGSVDDIYRVLSFDEIVYNDDADDEQYQDELMWSISLSNRCHKSIQALFLPPRSSKEDQSLTATQTTKIISNKKQTPMLPNIRKLSLSPASPDTITGATVEGSTYTKSSDKNDESNSSSSSWISLWCCALSQSCSDDSLACIQRRFFGSSMPAPPIPDYVVMKQEIYNSSEHLLQQLENDEDKSSSITVFEDDDSFWTM